MAPGRFAPKSMEALDGMSIIEAFVVWGGLIESATPGVEGHPYLRIWMGRANEERVTP